MRQQAKEFLLAEFAALRREIDEEVKDMEAYAKYALVVSGALWGALISFMKDVLIPTHFAWVPAILTALMFVQNLAIMSDLKRIGAYIARVEAAFALPGDLGWETSLRRNVYHFAHNDWRLAFWVVLILANVLGGFLYPQVHARLTP